MWKSAMSPKSTGAEQLTQEEIDFLKSQGIEPNAAQ
jgi:hypothetical protein